MVKGISRRVVVVRPEHSKVFEEAIFVVRDGGGPPCDALREACRVAERYLAAHPRRARPRRLYTLPQLVLSALGGGGLVGAVWAVMAVL